MRHGRIELNSKNRSKNSPILSHDIYVGQLGGPKCWVQSRYLRYSSLFPFWGGNPTINFTSPLEPHYSTVDSAIGLAQGNADLKLNGREEVRPYCEGTVKVL